MNKYELIGLLITLAIVIVIVVIAYGTAYLIATSNLPEWFKYYLLH